jgi:diguanylate cyclase (GGDEF)-like protein
MNRDPLVLGPDPGSEPGARGMFWQLAELVLTADARQRRCLTVLLLTAVVYGVCIALMLYGAAAGIFEPLPMYVLSGLIVVAMLTFYALMRSGLNLRSAEPTLAFQQVLVAQTLAAGAYAFSGPVHAATLMLFALIMIFGMFDMQVRHARFLTVYSVTLIGLVMLWRTQDLPEVYIARLELIYLVMLATVLAAISQVSVLLSTMRRRLKTQKGDLERAMAHIQLLATHDELTGLANRRHILDLINQHALLHARGGPSFYLAMADLDHFKNINDIHGHAVGDEALRTFARQAHTQLRNTDAVGRWGGEEFLLLMPETPPGDPNVGLERLRASLAACEASQQVAGLHVQFSAGLSRYREGETISATIERADRAMYAAKAAGRHRTVAL